MYVKYQDFTTQSIYGLERSEKNYKEEAIPNGITELERVQKGIARPALSVRVFSLPLLDDHLKYISLLTQKTGALKKWQINFVFGEIYVKTVFTMSFSNSFSNHLKCIYWQWVVMPG